MFELVKTVTKDKLVLHGLFSRGDKRKTAVIYIHGFREGFFTEEYILEIAKKLKKNRVSFLSVQTRGTASDFTLETTDGKFKRIGSDFEVLSEAYLDIDSWVGFLLEEGFQNIVIIGHSIGALKVIRYLFEGKHPSCVKALILLAPPDNVALTEIHTKGKWTDYLKEAVKKVKEGKGEDMIPSKFLDVIISYRTYDNWHNEGDLSNIFSFHKKAYNFPILNKVKVPVLAIFGTKDEFLQMVKIKDPKIVLAILRKNIKNFTGSIIKDANHTFEGYEAKAANLVSKFVENV